MAEQVRFSKLHHCVYALSYHLVLVTRHRRRCITGPMLGRLREIAAARCEGWRGRLLELDGEPDHVRLLVSLPPDTDLSGFVNNLKTTTSRLLRRDFAEHLAEVYREPGFWSRSYGIVTCDDAPLSLLEQHIERQQRPE